MDGRAIFESVLVAVVIAETFGLVKLREAIVSATKPPAQALVSKVDAAICDFCGRAVHRFDSVLGRIKCENCISEGK